MDILNVLRGALKSRRAARLLAPCDFSQLGLEIGGSFQPVAPRSKGFLVETLDHLDREHLVEKYVGTDGVDTSRIEEVDHVWDGRPYADLIGQQERYAWIVASHMIEHAPDLIGFLKDCSSVLKPGGIVALAIPDQRYTFDLHRPSTGLAQVIDAHLRGDRKPSPGTLVELHLRSVRKGGRLSWRPWQLGKTCPADEFDEAIGIYRRALASDEYIDGHVWCFTPTSFSRLLRELRLVGELDLEVVRLESRWGLEFFAWLRKIDGM